VRESDLGRLVTVEYHLFEDWQKPFERMQSFMAQGYNLVTIHRYMLSLYNVAYLQRNGNGHRGDAKSG
jgi:hypothetical protein